MKKTDKGCLALYVPEPRFLSHPSHGVCILLRKCPSKADCLWLKNYYRARITKYRNLVVVVSLTKFTESSKAPIKHCLVWIPLLLLF
jgi:hypothetical protein